MLSFLHVNFNSQASTHLLTGLHRNSPVILLNRVLLLSRNRLSRIRLRNSLPLWRDIQPSAPMTSPIMHTFAEDTWRGPGIINPGLGFILALVEDIFEVEGVDVAREETEDGEADVNEEVGAAACDEEDTEGRKEDGDDYNEDCGEHFVDLGVCVLVVCVGDAVDWAVGGVSWRLRMDARFCGT
jgi:hypothetical protein